MILGRCYRPGMVAEMESQPTTSDWAENNRPIKLIGQPLP